MSRFHKSGSFASRRPTRSPQDLRAGWVSALALAADLTGMVLRTASEPADPDPLFGQTLTRFNVTIRDLEPANFPVNAESARTMAAAFLALARSFGHPAWSPQARTACAPFLKAGTDCLGGLMDRLRAEEAQHSRRMLGERDED